MIIIDGSEGEGGGQIVRNACALSLVTAEPFRITNIRGGREKPGLMRQHVTAIEAACAIGGGTCEGVSVGSGEMSFTPGTVQGGDYHFAVGTAGSTGLVLQTILMPLVLAGTPSRLVLEGGTHNMLAPPFEFIERCFLPVINRMGPTVTAKLVRHGFYPSGGGRIEVEITPAPLVPVDCTERGTLIDTSAIAFFAGLPFDVADREIQTAKKLLDWPERSFAVRELPEERGPGNILLLEARHEHATEIVSGFGKARRARRTCGQAGGGADEGLSRLGCLCRAVSGRSVAVAVRAGGRRVLHHGQAERAQPDGRDDHRTLPGPALRILAVAGRDAPDGAA